MPRFLVTVRRDCSTEWADVRVTAKNKAEAREKAEKEAESCDTQYYTGDTFAYTAEEVERE